MGAMAATSQKRKLIRKTRNVMLAMIGGDRNEGGWLVRGVEMDRMETAPFLNVNFHGDEGL